MNSVIFLLRSFGVGGAEHQLILLASGLQQRGYSVKVAVFYAGEPLETEAKSIGIQIVDLKRRGRWDLLPFFLRLVNLIRKEKPDILHSYLQVPNIWASFIKVLLPDTKVVWGIRASNMDMGLYNRQWQLTDKVESLLAQIPDWIICNSYAGLFHHVQKGYPSERMSVIHNGIDTQRFYPNRKLGERLRSRWEVRAGQKLIGMVARVDPVKDYPNFLRAASLLAGERNDIRFVCVGGGSDRYLEEYQKLSQSLNLQDYLIWTGEHVDMVSVYNALDILVLSSTSEGFSNVIGESMACGTPCVVTDVGDGARVIGNLGEIVIPGKPDALKQGILKLLSRLAEETPDLNIKARQRIIDHFSVGRLISDTNNTFNNLLAGDGTTAPTIKV